MSKLERLVALRLSGEQPDPQLRQWIEHLPPKLQARLARIGVLDATSIAAGKPLTEHLAEYGRALLDNDNVKQAGLDKAF